MNRRKRHSRHRGIKLLASAAGLAAAGYAAWAGFTYWRYGYPRPGRPDDADALLDRFMPWYEVVDRHHVAIGAPAAITLAAARRMRLTAHPVIRAIFRTREVLLGASSDSPWVAQGLADELVSLGWGVLAETPDREIVFGAVTRPWEADVVFRAVPPIDFAAFAEPGHVKIVVSLRADPDGPDRSIFRTETRAVATDESARARFRVYWSWFSPGIALIRRLSLAPLKADAERVARLPHV